MNSKSNTKHNHFIIDIMETQGHTWQGHIEWIEMKKEENFRSALELIKLIDSAVEEQKMGDK